VAVLGSPRASNEENYLLGKFARAILKTNNLSLSSDAGQEESARVLLEGCGWPAMTGTLAELRQADFILVVGGDLTKQNPIIASEIHHAHRAGTFLATISPRKLKWPGSASFILDLTLEQFLPASGFSQSSG